MNNRKSRWTREEMAAKLDVAFRAASFAAYKKARETQTPLVIWRDGEIVEIDPNLFSFDDVVRPPATPTTAD